MTSALTEGVGQWNVSERFPDQRFLVAWRLAADPLIDGLHQMLAHAGREPIGPAPIEGLNPAALALIEIYRGCRVLAAYEPHPIIGLEYTGENDDDGNPIPLRDGDAELVYLYGPPCWQLRVDCFAGPTEPRP